MGCPYGSGYCGVRFAPVLGYRLRTGSCVAALRIPHPLTPVCATL